MAILSKIRDRSMFLLIVVGLALFSFVLSPSSIKNFFSASKVNTVGVVNGEKITRNEFSAALESYKGQLGNGASQMLIGRLAWNNLVREKIYEQQLEKAGVAVGESDVWNKLIDAPFIKNNPQYKTNGLFDQEKLKEFLATTKADKTPAWKAWQNYVAGIKKNLEQTTYNNLVTVGLGASLSEAKDKYFHEKTNVDVKYVYIPYTSIPDSLVTVSKSEISSYIKAHSKMFKVEASRGIKYVKFPIIPTAEDEKAIEQEVAKLLDDREEYSAVSKGNITIQGLKNIKDIAEFFTENHSDISWNPLFKFKNEVPAVIADKVFDAEKGVVFGPYKDKGFFKISKVVAITQIPDSVKARHILIPFVGSRAATATTVKTQGQAKKTADSLLTVIKKHPSDFAKLAKIFSADKSNADKGGDLGWFTYKAMVPTFRDYAFEHKKGSLGVIKSVFGFHIIRIEDQKNIQKAVKLATFARKIEASEATENVIFQKAGIFSLGLSKGEKYDELIKKDSLVSHPAVGLKILDENIPGLGNERDVVSWAFDKDIKIGDFKRFDVSNGYVVAVLTDKTKKGLMPVLKATANVRPILIKQKKTVRIAKKMNGTTLEAIAKANKTKVIEAYRLNLNSPVISGVGKTPKVIGAMLMSTINKVCNQVAGAKGVFAFQVTKRAFPVALPNYNLYRNKIADQRKRTSYKIYEALKESATIEDNRATYYGVNN